MNNIEPVIGMLFFHLYRHFVHKQQIEFMDNNINFCIVNNAHLYSSETRNFIQQIIHKVGIKQTVIAISGMVLGGKEEISFGSMIGKNNKTFYVNIPFLWLYFLNDLVKKIDNKEVLTEIETSKLHSFLFLFHHELNHVKKMISGTSYASRIYFSLEGFLYSGLFVTLQLYLAHQWNISYLKQIPLFFLFVFFLTQYAKFKQYKEESECDILGIDSKADLVGGVQWLLVDAKNYVNEVFRQQSIYIQNLYRKYPDFICPFITGYPDPLARVRSLEKKIKEQRD